MIEPVPRQSSHGSLNPNAPWLRLTMPEPLQRGHTRGLVPGLAPLPWQVVHGDGLVSRSGTVTPVRCLAEAERRLGLDVATAPRAGLGLAAALRRRG